MYLLFYRNAQTQRLQNSFQQLRLEGIRFCFYKGGREQKGKLTTESWPRHIKYLGRLGTCRNSWNLTVPTCYLPRFPKPIHIAILGALERSPREPHWILCPNLLFLQSVENQYYLLLLTGDREYGETSLPSSGLERFVLSEYCIKKTHLVRTPSCPRPRGSLTTHTGAQCLANFNTQVRFSRLFSSSLPQVLQNHTKKPLISTKVQKLDLVIYHTVQKSLVPTQLPCQYRNGKYEACCR